MTDTPETRTWTAAEIKAIGDADDFHVSVFHEDGKPGTLTWIWSVVMDDEVYIRSFSGTGGKWYSSMLHRPAGKITAGGGEYEVGYEVVDHPTMLNDIDMAYHEKYGPSPYVEPMVSDRARSATVRVRPTA